jgi:chromosome segregation ATPase
MSTLQTEYSDLYGRVGGLEHEVLDLEDDISELRDENYDLKVALEEMEWEKDGYKSEVETLEEKIEDLEYYPSDMLAQVYANVFQAKADSLDFDHRIEERDETIERLQNELDRLVPCPLTEEEAEALTEIVPADFGITIGKRVREIVKKGEEEEEDVPFKVARIA